jgi:hypothetical protein
MISMISSKPFSASRSAELGPYRDAMLKKIDYHRHIDPEYNRWGRKYPKFPGVAECIRLLQARNVRGVWVDIIVYELAAHADECLPELEAAFRSDLDEWVRLMVLMAIEMAQVSDAVPFLTEVLRERHPRFTPYAERGLSAIGTKEARAALWNAAHAEPGAAPDATSIR